jgi:hypothetical protein
MTFKNIDTIMYKQYLVLPINHPSPHSLPGTFAQWHMQLASDLYRLVLYMTNYLLRLFTTAIEGEAKGKGVSRASCIETQVKGCVERAQR